MSDLMPYASDGAIRHELERNAVRNRTHLKSTVSSQRKSPIGLGRREQAAG